MAAADDPEHISSYLHTHHPDYAVHTLQRIYSSARSLRQSAEKGRPGRIEGTRELVLTPLPYLIVYSVSAEGVHLLRIFHGAQERL
jgi:toxin ParE1/3/4